MAQRDRNFWLKTLIVAACAILIGDVLVLTCIIVPLAAPRQKRAEMPAVSARLNQSARDQALILPTHDSRKAWATRTPLPTATPWLIRTPTLGPETLALAGPAASAAQIPANAPGASTTPESGGGIAPMAPSPPATDVNPVSTPRPTSLPSASTPVPAVTSSTDTVLMDTPTPAGMLPTETAAAPTDTPTPTESPGTDQPPPTTTPGKEAQFEAYVRDHYNTVGGQPLNIVSVTLDITAAGIPRFKVAVAGADTNNMFAAQPAAAVSDYGHRLLDDTKSYFAGQHCAITVASTYETSRGDACTNNSFWCELGTFNASANTWTVTWTYVWGSSIEGWDTVQIWNAGQ